MVITKAAGLHGEVCVPGDKSVSHRSVMFGSIAKGTTKISHYLQGADCLSTISCFRKMGIEIENQGDTVLVHGRGLRGLKGPDGALDCGNSGTTTRLISGILAAQNFDVVLTGDDSIQKRPMKRIMEPLTLMGARIRSLRDNGCAPLEIAGGLLRGIDYTSKVASAQVKSAILLAGLYAEGDTKVTEPFISRNHSEIMLKYFGADVRTEGTAVLLHPGNTLEGRPISVPGDISSAAYFICAGLMVPNSEIFLPSVGINPTRDGILKVCQAMGGKVTLLHEDSGCGEPTADILVQSSSLHGTVIEGALIPTLIDELPMIAAMACFADGETVIRDAAELKVKESNRLEVMVRGLTAMGAHVTETEDGMIIHGGRPLHGAEIDSHLDHRIAMTFAVAGLCADGETRIKGAECVNISYPEFYGDLKKLI